MLLQDTRPEQPTLAWPQVKLKQIVPRTEEEKTEHSVAAERRRMRLLYADTIKDLLANYTIKDGEGPQTREWEDPRPAVVGPSLDSGSPAGKEVWGPLAQHPARLWENPFVGHSVCWGPQCQDGL